MSNIRTFTIKQVISESPGLSRSSLYREMKAGRLGFLKVGARRLVLEQDLEQWIESLRSGPDRGE